MINRPLETELNSERSLIRESANLMPTVRKEGKAQSLVKKSLGPTS